MASTVELLANFSSNPSSRPTPSSMALLHAPSSLGSLLRRPKLVKLSASAASISPPRGLGCYLSPLRYRAINKRCVFSLASSHDESKQTDVEVDNKKTDVKSRVEESQEAWKQTLDSFREQATKLQGMSQEAYELYSEKAMIILKETADKLKIEAEKARQDLSVIAKEISEESKEYLSVVAENSPEQVKDIMETFASADEINDVTKVLDFYLGIPYGLVLSVGGFLSFMVTGSTSAIRFGVILGGALLALSILSFRSWKKGEPNPLALKGQAAIATILFLRELRLLFVRPFVFNFIVTLISGAMVVFYTFRIFRHGGGNSDLSGLKTESES